MSMFRKNILLCGAALMLVPGALRAAPCMYIDDNFNVVEYECNQSTDDTPADDGGFRFNFVISGAFGLSATQQVPVYMASQDTYPNVYAVKQKYDIDTPLEISLGLRLSNTNSHWFHEFDVGYMQLYGLKSRLFDLANTALVGADVGMVSYSLGYNVSDNISVYGRAGIGYASYFNDYFEFNYCDEEGCSCYFGYEEDESSTVARFGVGMEMDVLDWLKLYGEYDYIMDFGDGDDFWIMSNFSVQTFMVGAKLIF